MQNFEDSDIRELEINQDSFQLYLSKNKQTHKHEDLITTEKTEQTTSVKKKKANEQPTLPSQNITAPQSELSISNQPPMQIPMLEVATM